MKTRVPKKEKDKTAKREKVTWRKKKTTKSKI
jgi:hypothetical protein